MPCFDPQDSQSSKVSVVMRDNPEVSAMFCSVLSFLESSKTNGCGSDLLWVLDNIDWAEAGVTRERLESWWKEHKAEDRARRERERAKANKERLRQQAISKLSPSEIKALGL